MPPLGQGIPGELDPHAYCEAEPVVQEVEDIVPLVVFHQRQVVGEHIVLSVVHHAVVEVVHAGGSPKKQHSTCMIHMCRNSFASLLLLHSPWSARPRAAAGSIVR